MSDRQGGPLAIEYVTAESWLGTTLVASSAEGICAVLLGDEPGELVEDLRRRFPSAEVREAVTPQANAAAAESALAAVESPSATCDQPLDLHGTEFQRRVWEALRTIPAGTTVTYAELAEKIGAPTATRARSPRPVAPTISPCSFPATAW